MSTSLRQFLFLAATDQEKGFFINIVKFFLWFLSCCYGLVINLILFGYRIGYLKKYRLPRPVISIGNITWGGVGKTPFVLWLAKELKKQNLKPVILTRGYMGKKRNGVHLSDEAEMLKRILKDVPVLVGQNRIACGHQFLQNNEADVFILDDGFQYWRLYRDLDVVLVDTANPWGNGQLIPRGILREPLRQLSRAQAVILTKTDLAKENVPLVKNHLRKISSKLFIGETVHKAVKLKDIYNPSTCELSFLDNKRIASLCSIGDPKSFESTLRNSGAQVIKSFPFMDHHTYTEEEIIEIAGECLKESIRIIVTTQKDAVKIASFQKVINEKINIFCLEIDMSFVQGKDEFIDRIYHLVHS